MQVLVDYGYLHHAAAMIALILFVFLMCSLVYAFTKRPGMLLACHSSLLARMPCPARAKALAAPGLVRTVSAHAIWKNTYNIHGIDIGSAILL